jgi:predicted DnaQ family exonuclease/DinG family helicase
MPRLFDLLPENTRKELLAEARARSRPEKRAKGPGKPVKRPPLIVPDFVALDVETTGLDFKHDRIIEIGCIKFVSGRPEEEFSTFINAGVAIPSQITDLTGISEADIKNAPSFPEIVDKLLEFIGNHPLCGHQIEFDATFISEELKRINRPSLNVQLLDTALLSRILLQPLQRFSLKAVSESLNVQLDNAHRALYDARASGEVAVNLVPRISSLPLNIRQTMAACAPGSFFKSLLIKSLGSCKPLVRLENNRPPISVARITEPEEYVSIERENVGQIFSSGGDLQKTFQPFTPRSSQKEMALQVTDALNTQSFLIAEAGTGTGKSLAYLIPSAFWALANNCRVIVSTRTRNLQDQLFTKDLPLVKSITGGKLKFTVLKGRNNYICLHRWKKLLTGDAGNLSPRERFAVLPLIPWVENTATGDIEEQNQFNPKWFNKIWNLISAESHECCGRHCEFFQSCFFHQARQKALGSHIVIINHSLFFSDICSENSFLGKNGSIIFDEAHHLESCGHRHLRVELDTNRLNLFIDMVNNLVLKIGDLKEEKSIYENGKEIRSLLKHFRKRSQGLLMEIEGWVYSQQKDLTRDYQAAYTENAFECLTEPFVFETVLNELFDKLHSLKQAIIAHPEAKRFDQLESDLQSCSDRASQLKADFQYLISARTEDHVFWVEGNREKGWVKLCGVPLDIGGMLSDVWSNCNGAIVFTSATMSISKSVEYFKNSAGLIPHSGRTSTGIFQSPFSPGQAIAGALRNSPEPDSPQFCEYTADVIVKLHSEFQKNILVLFTSNTMLSTVYDLLRAKRQVESGKLLAQGISGTRQNILEQFKQNQRRILLGTDSFWEGIDVPGEACEIVVIVRLPFPVPTHPLTQAITSRIERIKGESFFSYSVPEAVIKFRQGAGRLIRTIDDRGALIVLDNRILTKGYGKQFIRSIDCDFKDFEGIPQMISQIKRFFASDTPEPDSGIRYVPLEDA